MMGNVVMRTSRSALHFLAAVVFAGILVGACGPAPAGSTAPPSAVVSTILLREAPANLGCDAMGVPYRSATIRIDASAAEQVWAETDTGTRLDMFWARGFAGGPGSEPVVVDPEGQVVARDGEQIAIPDGAWPRLHGYFVCPSSTAIYVLLQDPA